VEAFGKRREAAFSALLDATISDVGFYHHFFISRRFLPMARG
jgi:hypothetical protein